MVKRKKNIKLEQAKGFTLIELMLATSLLMVVMFSGYYAYSLYSQKWQKRVQVFWQNTEQAVALDTMNKVMSSALPYIVNCKNNKACIYFKGTETSVSFISNSAIFSAEPALVELSVVDNKTSKINLENNFQLIYREQSIADNLVLRLEHQSQWQHEIVLLKNLNHLNFSFFGWQTFLQASQQANNEALIKDEFRTWYQQHDADASRLLPEKIRISFSSVKGESNFQVALSQHSLFKLLTYTQVDI